ncbi:uncharacterized protein LOC129950743 [Eupeodes corollae]|uniref:uncharacterized protein LOC129950743 n=1 Tax=Eupeodes corollae TaxID=290404 RepID=UPI00249375C7|nr:uncharacterized protein LOC129950743 [Eupeodes corollae]
MKSDHLLLVLMVISGLFYFSEGKPCPENTQPHKSRCDVYFKCVILPSQTHIWIPEKCEEGLIYDPNMRMCVLPGDDWECNLEEVNRNTHSSNSDDENVVFQRNEAMKRSLDSTEDSTDDEKDSESEEIGDDEDAKESDYIIVDDSESGLASERDLESSGDGEGTDYILLDTLSPERKTSDESTDLAETTTPTKIDPNLTAHLQRLTQLIDGLKQTYQNKDSAAAELRPDQLNAFLAHYNIKAQLDSIDPSKEENFATATPKIDPIKQNQSLEVQESTTSTTSELDPETKVILTNQYPNGYSIPRPNDGYSNSQIVVNKPEGSVLFTLGNQPKDSTSSANHRFKPKISEDTLKTVLQLSKQMLDSQEVRRVVPSSAYYPQVVQPIYLSPPIPQFANSAFNQHIPYDKFNYFGPSTKPVTPSTTIIHNNVHIPGSNDRIDQVDSYGQKVHSYPPIPTYHYSSEGSSEVQDHNLANRYENNQLVTIRPSKGYSNSYQSTTTSRPYVSDTSGSTLFDYYTLSPHLDESNVNNVFQMEKYPTLNIGSNSGRPPMKSHKRPDSHHHKSQFYQNSYHNGYHHPSQQSILKLFPTHIDPSKVKIRPNSQKLESMEQDASDDNDGNDGEEEYDYSQSSSGDDNHSETYNRYNANKQITANQLAQYVGQFSGGKAPSHSHQIYGGNSETTFFHQNEDESSQVGSYASGNDLTYDLFNRKVSPPLPYDSSKPDATSCPVGIRQPNATECTRYYVCSKEDGRVMQYSCPSFTAFNPQTRICDAQYYAICHPTAIINRYTVSENKRVQLEAIKALHDAKRIREQVLRAQNIALRLRLGENHQSSSTTPSPQLQQYSSDVLSNFLQNAIDTNSVSGSSDKDSSYSSSVSQRPNSYTLSSSSSSSSSAGGNRKRKYYCKEGDKVADQTSIYNYFVCYKNSQGVMKGHKMTCSEGLLFCPMTSMCTLPRKCS